jgi:hypothetical protein
VNKRCSGDSSLRNVLEALLEADAAPGAILDASPEDLSRLLADDDGSPRSTLAIPSTATPFWVVEPGL